MSCFLKIKKTTVKVGLEKPLRVLHISDSHLPFYCENDTENIIKQGKKRNAKRNLTNFLRLMKYSEKKCDIVIHTGDLIDFISEPCVEFARDFLKNDKILFVAGNHEYWRCDGSREDMSHRKKSLEIMGGELCNGMFFNSRIVGGINFVGIDDSFHQTEPEQLEFLKAEVKKGYPVILFVHAPLYEKSLYKKSYKFWNGEICLLGSDASIHQEVAGDIAEPSASTKDFYGYVNREPKIKAVLAGHLHFAFESLLPGGTVQYVTGKGCNGYARKITFI